jgi:DNA polymerase (family 10)
VRNEEIADRLDSLATLLDAAGSTRYAVRAYRRAAELVRTTPVDVAELVRAGRARELAGVGESIEARLRELVETGELAEEVELRERIAPKAVERAQRRRRGGGRGLLLNRSRAIVASLAESLGGVPAGDPRRGVDLSRRLAVACADPAALDRLAELPEIVSVVERGPAHAVAVHAEGVPVEVHVGPLGTALVRATGSEEHVAALGELPSADDEEELYAALGLAYRPPELREAWSPEPPPDLVGLEQVRGDLHVHSDWSDGKASVVEMARAARERGYEYLAICDHTRNVRVVPGLDADDLRRQAEEIAAANAAVPGIRVLRGTECDILPDGSLDLPDDVLAELDWVQISLHAGQRASRDELTKRVTEAMRHPAASCLSHPKGRILNHRPENALDLEETIAVALETGVALEVNGLPDRLDLAGEHVRLVIEAGVPVVCSTDAHSTRGLGNMALAIATARRGGAPAPLVLNTLPLEEALGRRRRLA